jgi:hypothetical protein
MSPDESQATAAGAGGPTQAEGAASPDAGGAGGKKDGGTADSDGDRTPTAVTTFTDGERKPTVRPHGMGLTAMAAIILGSAAAAAAMAAVVLTLRGREGARVVIELTPEDKAEAAKGGDGGAAASRPPVAIAWPSVGGARRASLALRAQSRTVGTPPESEAQPPHF